MAACRVTVSEEKESQQEEEGGEGTQKVHLSFPEPQRAVTPGQVVTLYDKETNACVGGGIIEETCQ